VKFQIPHPLVILFGLIILVSILTHWIPAGEFDRIEKSGKLVVLPNTYKTIDQNPIGVLKMFTAIPKGFKAAIEIIFVVFASGIMFGIMDKTGAITKSIRITMTKIGYQNRSLMIVLMTFLYGLVGVFVGYENNIALIPMAVAISLAMGGDLILAAAISVGGITVGFGLSPINPYTIGTGHFLADLPLFSGALLRSILCASSLAILSWYNVRYLKSIETMPSTKYLPEQHLSQSFTGPKNESLSLSERIILMSLLFSLTFMVIGVMKLSWFLQEISALFLITAMIMALIARISPNKFAIISLQSVANIAPGVFMIGFAATIKVILEESHISDTIAYQMTQALSYLPQATVSVGMATVQCLLNFLIPSGSGQAMATLPIMIPAGEAMGLTRQTTVLAFQIGDGVTNLINPSLGGLLAMLSIINVPFDKWLKFIFPVTIFILLLSFIFLIISVKIDYGPF